jgi:2-dehydropantoate 2-reductase
MRTLGLGAGSTGGYYGARLIESGHDVSFLVRPARAAILSTYGLRVIRARGDFAQPVHAVDAIPAGVRYDLVIVSSKAGDLESAIASIAPAVGTDTCVLPLLNGLRHLDALDAVFGPARVLGGLCHISVTLEEDGVIRQFGTLDRLTFGSRDPAHPVPSVVSDGLASLGEGVVRSCDVLGAMWEKFAFIASLAGLTCVMRAAVGEIVATPDGRQLMQRLYSECVAIASSEGHAPDEIAQAAALDILCAAGSPLKASMLRDLERGARTECEHILGDLRGRALKHGLDTPVLCAALAHLRLQERRTV